MCNQRDCIKMADSGHAITQMDFLICQAAFLSNEIRNAVCKQLNVLRLKTALRDLGKQTVVGALPECLQIMLIVVANRFFGQSIQQIRKRLLGKPVGIRKPTE